MSVLLEKVTATFANRSSDLAERHRGYVMLIVECKRFAQQTGNQVNTFQEVVQALNQTARGAEQWQDTKFASLVRKQLLKMEDCLRVRLAQERAAEKTSNGSTAPAQDLPYRGLMECLDDLHGMLVTLWKSFRPTEGDILPKAPVDSRAIRSIGVPPAPLTPQKTITPSNVNTPPLPATNPSVAQGAPGRGDNVFLPQGAIPTDRSRTVPPAPLSVSAPPPTGKTSGPTESNTNTLTQILALLDSPVASTTRANVSVQRLTMLYNSILATQPDTAKQILPYIDACKEAINDSTRPLSKREEFVRGCTLRIIKILEAVEKGPAPLTPTLPPAKPASPDNVASIPSRRVPSSAPAKPETSAIQKRLVEAENRDLELLKKQLEDVRTLNRAAEQRAAQSEQRLQETLLKWQNSLEQARAAESTLKTQLQLLKEEFAHEKEKSGKGDTRFTLAEQTERVRTVDTALPEEMRIRTRKLLHIADKLLAQQSTGGQIERNPSAPAANHTTNPTTNPTGDPANNSSNGTSSRSPNGSPDGSPNEDDTTPSASATGDQKLFQSEELTSNVYGALPSAGVMAAFGSAASMLYAEVAALQYQLHLALVQAGWELIYPRSGERADTRRHHWSDADLEIIHDDPSRDGAIASVLRPGLAHNGTVLNRAEVRRYTYLPPPSDNDLFDK